MTHHRIDVNAIEEPAVYRMVRWLSSEYFEGIHRHEFIGLENIPPSGGFLLACNHASYYDPPLVGYPLSRPIYYFARKDLLRFRVSNWLLPRLFTIPVDRDGPSDVAALKRVFSVLKEGAGLLVFPEGTRTLDGALQPGKPGVGMLACKVKVPVVPTRVYGTFESFGKYHKTPDIRPRLTVVYGKPLTPEEFDPGGKGKDRYEIASQRIVDAIGALEVPDIPLV